MSRNLWNPWKYWTDRFGEDSSKRFDKIDAPVYPQNIEACHRLKSDDNGRNNKVIVNISKLKDMVRVMNKKKSLKNANLDSTGLP